MLSLSYARRQNILMARFSGVFSSQDMDELDRAVIAFTARQGPSHGLVDFSGIDAVSLPPSRLLQRSQQPPFSPGYKRVFVAPGPPSLELARTFAEQQILAGGIGPVIVATLEEAYQHLRIAKSVQFEAVE